MFLRYHIIIHLSEKIIFEAYLVARLGTILFGITRANRNRFVIPIKFGNDYLKSMLHSHFIMQCEKSYLIFFTDF